MYTRVKTPAEIENMRVSGRMLATVLDVLKNQLTAGITALDLDGLAAKELKSLGGVPAFKGYQGFPATICISVNHEVVHGIPTAETIIQDGDIVSMDFGVTYNGMITDSAVSVICGQAGPAVHDLLKYTKQSLDEGLAVIKDGVKTGDIAHAVQKVLEKQGYGIVRDLVGHGVGHAVHEDPNIPNYGRKGTGPVLVAGMTVAIEPMATMGTHKVLVAPDGWTILTADNSLSAHFEHTVLITHDGCEILTTI